MLNIPFAEGATEYTWGDAFGRLADLHSSETRGQTWDDVRWVGDGILVTGITPGTNSDALQTYVDQLVQLANADAPRERQRIEREHAEAWRRSQEGGRAASDLAAAFKRGGNG